MNENHRGAAELCDRGECQERDDFRPDLVADTAPDSTVPQTPALRAA